MIRKKHKNWPVNLLYISLVRILAIFSFNSYAVATNELQKVDYKSPVGYWKTIDDQTGAEKSIILLEKNTNNEITGKVVKILKLDDGGDPETKVCDKCTGNNKNKLIKGMTILWGVTQDRQNPEDWDGGHILDPKTGSIYNVKFSLGEDGKTLNIRGYIGFSLLGRTQVWQRVSHHNR